MMCQGEGSMVYFFHKFLDSNVTSRLRTLKPKKSRK